MPARCCGMAETRPVRPAMAQPEVPPDRRGPNHFQRIPREAPGLRPERFHRHVGAPHFAKKPPRVAPGLMPYEDLHQLWFDRQCAGRHQRQEIHSVHSIRKQGPIKLRPACAGGGAIPKS